MWRTHTRTHVNPSLPGGRGRPPPHSGEQADQPGSAPRRHPPPAGAPRLLGLRREGAARGGRSAGCVSGGHPAGRVVPQHRVRAAGQVQLARQAMLQGLCVPDVIFEVYGYVCVFKFAQTDNYSAVKDVLFAMCCNLARYLFLRVPI